MYTMTETEYHAESENGMGLCTACQEITTACCEPDARRYTCDECDEHTVYGLEEALMMGLISIT